MHFARTNLPPALKKIIIGPTMTHYSDNPHTKYYDWNWCKDEFVPPLSNNELEFYINNPKKFRTDFLKNLKLFITFCRYLKKHIRNTVALAIEDQLVSALVFLYLFQSAMDHHYYRFDYLLDLEEYPKSPLGWHYLRIQRLLEPVAENNEKLLQLLTPKGKEVIEELKPSLSSKSIKLLEQSHEAIQIFLRVQQEEEKLFYGKNKNGPILKTGLSIWKMLDKIMKDPSNKELSKFEALKDILAGDPIVGTRKVLTDFEHLFPKKIATRVRSEIKLSC